MRIAVLGGHGKTGRAVVAALDLCGAEVVATGRTEWDRLAEVIAGCEAAYVIAPNLHPDEPAYVGQVLDALRRAGVGRVVYHSVASPYAPAMPHHLGKARSEDLVRRSGLAWTILQPGAYLQNLPGHRGATYELASRVATVRELAGEAGVSAEQVSDPGTHPWLSDMFAYYDDHGLPAGPHMLRWLLTLGKQ